MIVLKGKLCELRVSDARQRDWFCPLAAEAWLNTYNAVMTARDVDFLFSELPLKSSTSVLDVGCGHGRHIREIACRSDIAICGIDSSGSLIDFARSSTPGSYVGIDYFAVIGCSPRFDCAYSLGTSFGYHADFKLAEWLSSVRSMLVEGGYFLFETVLVAECFVGQTASVVRETTYGSVRVRRLQHFDRDCGILRTTNTYSKGQHSEDVFNDFRVYSLDEISQACRDAGFLVIYVYNRERKVEIPGKYSSRYAFLLQRFDR